MKDILKIIDGNIASYFILHKHFDEEGTSYLNTNSKGRILFRTIEHNGMFAIMATNSVIDILPNEDAIIEKLHSVYSNFSGIIYDAKNNFSDIVFTYKKGAKVPPEPKAP